MQSLLNVCADTGSIMFAMQSMEAGRLHCLPGYGPALSAILVQHWPQAHLFTNLGGLDVFFTTVEIPRSFCRVVFKVVVFKIAS